MVARLLLPALWSRVPYTALQVTFHSDAKCE